MSDQRKSLIYWGVYFSLLAGGIALSFFRILPIKNTMIFLFGLMWLWTGLSVILNVNLIYAQQYRRHHQLLLSASSIGLGIAWVVLSLFPGSNQALPVLLTSAPFVLLDFWCWTQKRRGEENR